MKNIIIISILSIILVSACNQSIAPDENPEWITDLIKKYESEPVGHTPRTIWRYFYKGGIVYYIPAQCCDQPSTLYDMFGNVICAPDGGYFGREMVGVRISSRNVKMKNLYGTIQGHHKIQLQTPPKSSHLGGGQRRDSLRM